MVTGAVLDVESMEHSRKAQSDLHMVNRKGYILSEVIAWYL